MYIHVCVCVCVRVYTYVQKHICIYIYIYVTPERLLLTVKIDKIPSNLLGAHSDSCISSNYKSYDSRANCNLNKWEPVTGFSLTHNSLLVTQTLTPPKSSSPICVRVVGSVGSVEKFFYASLILVMDTRNISLYSQWYRGERGCTCAQYWCLLTLSMSIDTMSASDSWCKLTSESCPTRQKTCSTLASSQYQVTHSLFEKQNKREFGYVADTSSQTRSVPWWRICDHYWILRDVCCPVHPHLCTYLLRLDCLRGSTTYPGPTCAEHGYQKNATQAKIGEKKLVTRRKQVKKNWSPENGWKKTGWVEKVLLDEMCVCMHACMCLCVWESDLLFY
jgi:cell division protein FtsL